MTDMKRHTYLLPVIGLLWSIPQETLGVTITKVFWPEFAFIRGPDLVSIALFHLTDLTVGQDVTVTMLLDGTPEILFDDETGEQSETLTLLVSDSAGVVLVVKQLPENTSSGEYTESVTVVQGGSATTLSQTITVKTQADAARITIRPGKEPTGKQVLKPLAYTTKVALAVGSDISGSAGLPFSPAIAHLFVPEVRIDSLLVSKDLLALFTPSDGRSFLNEFFLAFPVNRTFSLGTRWHFFPETGRIEMEPDGPTLTPGSDQPTASPSYGPIISVLGNGCVVFEVPSAVSPPSGQPSGSRQQPASPGLETVNLTVYNIRGQRVKTLIDGVRPAGRYTIEWDGRDKRGHSVASGLYLYHLQVGNRSVVGKGLLLR
jgi:hypothetical protein